MKGDIEFMLNIGADSLDDPYRCTVNWSIVDTLK